ncbi:hypothetical protein NX784_25005 [Massilia pinisoli]|uniref:Uncharacterized protein n=1 Tax=Massilia pinisoli TaxID=1772194 RepID=A0ABT1ZYE0_9BURK|nr:hypothetical protein [Massilia pinisoli]MCS0584851.1 hypothetical protein [Massilia pinisoli]
MPITPDEMAARALRRGDESLFDASQEWHRANWHEDPTINPPPATDWAHRAARGIVQELSDDHGAYLEEAFHMERVGEEDRRAIIETMAAIIRRAAVESAGQ